MEQQQRNSNGTFQKGHASLENARRKKGVLNKLTADIRNGCIEGFARHGSNGRGEGGFPGFCFYLARKHPKAAAQIVEKLLPLQVNASGMSSGPSISQVNIISVPTDTYLSAEDMARFQPPTQTIEHVLQAIAPEPEHAPQQEEPEAPAHEIAPPEPDPIMQRAKAMGYTPLPPRIRLVD